MQFVNMKGWSEARRMEHFRRADVMYDMTGWTKERRMEHFRRERERYDEQELKRCFEEREEQEASTPCTTADAVPPEPAVAIEAPGEDLVASIEYACHVLLIIYY